MKKQMHDRTEAKYQMQQTFFDGQPFELKRRSDINQAEHIGGSKKQGQTCKGRRSAQQFPSVVSGGPAPSCQ